MVSDFLRWVSKENFKNQKIVKILISSINSMVPDHTVFEAFQMLKPDFISSSFIVNATNGLKFLDFEIKKDVLLPMMFFLFKNFAYMMKGRLFRLEYHILKRKTEFLISQFSRGEKDVT